MIRRWAAFCALVWTGFVVSPAAQAQGFFPFYEPSPRDVVDRLYDQGYGVHLPMVRRGDVYVVDALSSSHRPVRLIVSTRDGHILERYATASRGDDERPRSPRWRDEEIDQGSFGSVRPPWERHTHTALGDPADLPPRARDRESEIEPRPVPPAPLTEDPDKPKRHARRHAPVAKDGPEMLLRRAPSVAAVPPSEPRPPRVELPSPARSIEVPQAKIAPKPEPKPEPTSQAKGEDKPAPRVIPLTKPTPEAVSAPRPAPAAKIEDAPKPEPTSTQVKSEDKPAPTMTPKPAPTSQAKVEDKPKKEVPKAEAPKPEAPRRKLNDLPVGTLD